MIRLRTSGFRAAGWQIPAVCAAVAVALGAGAAAGAAAGKGVTALVHLRADDGVASIAPHGFVLVPRDAHYDGIYSYAIARDPLARGDAHRLIDLAADRYGHPGYGWVAWVASGGGQPGAVPYALLVVSLLAFAVAGAAASLLARTIGLSPWWGLSVAVNPALLFAVTADTTEVLMVALALAAVLFWLRDRLVWAAIALTLGCFTSESLLVVPFGILLWEVLRLASGRRPPDLPARVTAVMIGPALYAGWVVYCRHVFGALPSSEMALTTPLSGWVQAIDLATLQTRYADAQVGMVTAVLLVSLGGLLLAGIAGAARLRSPVDPIFVMLALLVFCEGSSTLFFPGDLIRLGALPLALAPFVLAGRGHAWAFRRERPLAPAEGLAA